MSGSGQAIPVENGTRRRGLVLILVIFVLGLVCGSALTVIGVRTVLPSRPIPGDRPPMGRGFEGMARQLDLDDEQRQRMQEIFRRSRRQVRRILEQSGEEMRSILDEEQREEFDRLRSRRGPGRRGRGPGPPPGFGPEPPPPGPSPDD